MEVTAFPGHLKQPPDTPVIGHQGRELGKHRLAIHSPESSAELATGDDLFGALTVGDVGICNPQTRHPIALFIKYRGPRNPANLENGFEGLAEYELVTFSQCVGHRPTLHPGHPYKILPLSYG